MYNLIISFTFLSNFIQKVHVMIHQVLWNWNFANVSSDRSLCVFNGYWGIIHKMIFAMFIYSGRRYASFGRLGDPTKRISVSYKLREFGLGVALALLSYSLQLG